MTDNNRRDHLFEVSWEVCNKVGGIYTVVRTKAPHAVKHFGDNYILIGPEVGNNPEFEETKEDLFDALIHDVEARGLHCRCGRWNIAGRPRVILVGTNSKYNIDELLYNLWVDYGVDSMSGEWDYIEPVLFGTAAGEVIEILHGIIMDKETDDIFIAQFHEWMSAAGMLYLKKQKPSITTVFTTHATMLGRSLAGSGSDIYRNMEEITPNEAASRMNISAKHSMETVAAREADCFTTVSEITAREAGHFLQSTPDVILPNGIYDEDMLEHQELKEIRKQKRDVLIEFASTFLQKKLDPDATRILMISGRYEFHNKGIDLFLESLKDINTTLKDLGRNETIVALLSVIGGHVGVSEEARQIFKGVEVQRTGVARICTHRLSDSQHDPIWNTCNKLNLLNNTDDSVRVIFMPVYLDGYDGILNVPYNEVISACDMGIFPSYYEPWGYTPLECASYCVPAITTDCSGFGLWVKNHIINNNKGVIVMDYAGREYKEVVDTLKKQLLSFLEWDRGEVTDQADQARLIAERATWKDFYGHYLEAYEEGIKSMKIRMHAIDVSAYTKEIRYMGTDSTQPRFNRFSVTTSFPESISRLREIAYNLWWSWNPNIKELFSRIDPHIWEAVSGNPIEMLERVDQKRMEEIARNESYLSLYKQVTEWMDARKMDSDTIGEKGAAISKERPIAYFSTEYAIDGSLPIYSGGLGVLSGDHLKSASDLSIPLVAVGLLYKNGFFVQRLNSEGVQEAHYPENDFSLMPIRLCEDGNGDPLKIHVSLPGRRLYAQIWKVNVGKVPLYLLDTNVSENSSQDMEITSKLYAGDQRLRIEQEIMLGVGGVRLLKAMGITPSVYHLNEGHSAFLLLERIRCLVKNEGLTFHEAKEVVKSTSVFTTHSPVEAANERFEESLMKNYFAEFPDKFGVSWETFWELGQEEPGSGKPFFMPVLAFKLSCASNAVSKLHGRVAREMWKKVWKGFEENEIPIGDITNGVHMQTWMAREFRELYEQYLGIDWNMKESQASKWENIDDIPDHALWQTHTDLKNRMADYLKIRMAEDCDNQGVSPAFKQRKVAALNPDALIVGFARRFAAYKRGTLIFDDPERLLKILEESSVPVQIVFAGKAHPSDETGQSYLKKIYEYTYNDRFIDKIFFIENYDLDLSKYLVSGVDLWLNNPLRPKEACGTSGMKVIPNGGLNMSILDGWWDEAYGKNRGWVIGRRKEYANLETQNLIDSQNLYGTLENLVIPAFAKRNAEGIPNDWVVMMKESIKALVPRFNTHRMLTDYYSRMYLPVAERGTLLNDNTYERAKILSDWKIKVASRFSTDHIRWYKVRGFHGERLEQNDTFHVEAGIEYGKMTEHETQVELVVIEVMDDGEYDTPIIVPMVKTALMEEDGTVVYKGSYRVEKSGRFLYGLRVRPHHPDLYCYQEVSLVHWA
ncbi:MAG: alpha-glucan family phosphorylase [Deltaproteobacteria bacterium]|nr:alpha-glucan family phosphorylase [Deltaproteobacteria bacterium]